MAEVNVILVRPNDTGEQTRLVLADPVGHVQAGALVTAEFGDGETFELVLHGQKEFDVPSDTVSVTFPDGTVWKPE